jgi:hypothetical protein
MMSKLKWQFKGTEGGHGEYLHLKHGIIRVGGVDWHYLPSRHSRRWKERTGWSPATLRSLVLDLGK